jgi:hypothetical protein
MICMTYKSWQTNINKREKEIGRGEVRERGGREREKENIIK